LLTCETLDINIKHNNFTPFQIAINQGHVKTVREFIRSGRITEDDRYLLIDTSINNNSNIIYKWLSLKDYDKNYLYGSSNLYVI